MTTKNNLADVYPLSPLQQGMLFHTLHAPQGGLYLDQAVYEIRTTAGEIDSAAFKKAWEKVVERHTVLRTAFTWEHRDEPLQAVLQRVNVPMREQDWSALTADEQQERLASFLRADRGWGFNLARAPLLRLALFHLGRGEHRLVFSYHHILMDAWSLPLVVREVCAFYEAIQRGGEPALAPAHPYRDYIAWLRRQDLSAAEAFWRRTLRGFETPTPLGLSSPPARRDDQEVPEYDDRKLRLTGEASAALQGFARRHRLTVNALVQGAWGLLLSRYSGEGDVVFGATVSGRPESLPGVESMVGLLINTLPVRVGCALAEPLVPWLGELLSQQLELRQFEHSPLIEVQGWSEVPRGLALFESILAFENLPETGDGQGRERSLRIRQVQYAPKTHYAVSAMVVPGAQMLLRLLYDCRRIETAAALRMLHHFRNLLEEIAGSPPGRPVSELSLLSPAERQQLLVEWNDTGREPSEHRRIEEWFEAQARRTPEAVAVLSAEEVLTYRELDRRANQLAAHLRRLNVAAGSLVAIHLARSAEMVTALLGVLKAGCAYVPVETHLPPARIHWTLERLGIPVLLTQTPLAASVLAGAELPALRDVVCLDPAPLPADGSQEGLRLWGREDLDRLPAEEAPGERGGDGIAYIIFTSGSTGTPKGVVVRHGPVCNLIDWGIRRFGMSPADRVLFITSLSFDLSVYDVFGLLAAGGSVRVASEAEVRDPERLVALLREEPITFWDSAPAALQQLVPFFSGSAEPGGRLRLVFLSGDWIPLTLPDQIRAAFPEARVTGLGGATEATVWSNVFPIEEVDPSWASIPYGRPIQNARYLILDSFSQAPCPIGVAGDLYIGGGCLALGYAQEPALTAAKFLPDGAAGQAGSVLYRTGDRARFLPDGNIEFLGRLDHQVKIRGFRVELGEIQAALAEHPAVGEALVLARPDPTGEKRLVAYIVPHSGPEVSLDELRAHLSDRLPEYMVPSAFVTLDAFPLTANGKIDRRALKDPERWSSSAEPAAEEAGNPVQELLQGIWAEVLGLDQVLPDDNFFEAGGHSLRATQVISRVRQALHLEIGLQDLFERPTIRELSEHVEAAMRGGRLQEVPPIGRVSRHEPLPLSFAQQRLWFIDQFEHGSAAYLVPVVLRLEGALDVAALRRAVAELVRRHEVLRTSFHAVAGQPFQRIAARHALPVPLVDLSGLGETRRRAEVVRLQQLEARTPFDLSRLPLLRVTLLRLDTNAHWLLSTFHHIVSDAWSVGISTRELATLYDAFSSGRPSPLPELAVQYADFAAWQRRWLAGEVLAAEIHHWKNRLAGAPSYLDLPTDRPRPEVLRFRGARRHILLRDDLSAALKKLGRREGVTLFMTLLAAFHALLSRHSGQPDVSIGTPVAGRNHLEIENLIGFFVNTLVLRALAPGEISFRELLARVRETVVDAHTHQDLPFEKLVDELAPQRNLSHSPLVQAVFTLQNLPPAASFPALKMVPALTTGGGAKFELTLSINEREGRLSGTLEYESDLFDDATIARMLGHYERLLETAVADPARRLSALPLLAEAEEHALKLEWNDTRTGSTGQACAHEPFEAQARRAPDAVAVLAEEGALTYGELNARANRLAHRLRACGVGPEVRVGLCLQRSAAMIVSELAVLKAGGAFLPLDAGLPDERLAFLLADSGLRVLVTQEALQGRLPAGGPAVVRIDADAAEIARESPANPPLQTGPENAAYVLYTSGSTGLPKGVVVSHRAILQHALDMGRIYPIAPGDRVMLFPSFNFDASVEQVVAPLAAGATIVLRGETLWSARELAAKIVDEEVTIIDLPTAYWHQVTTEWATYRGDLPNRLRLFLVGGEAMSPRCAALWSRTPFHSAILVNGYGPTETTVMATLDRVPDLSRAVPVPASVSVGRPLGDRTACIVDRSFRPAPLGAVGELCLGGACLARSYLGRPALTAERFIPDPFSQQPGARLYRTGDLARQRPDGRLDILGRADRQVKVRGFRVELGEIEAILSSHPAVQEAIVLLREDSPGEKRLVAYVVPRPNRSLNVKECRDHLAARLPEYMVPAAIVPLTELPLTTSGKVDRSALPAPQESLSERQDLAALHTPVEELLAGIWCEVLGVERVGRQDNFFELGGHSLLATQAVSWICDTFRINLPLRRMFELPTLAALAQGIEAAMGSGDGLRPPASIGRAPRDSPLPLSFAQERLWFLAQLEPESRAYNFSTAVRLSGPLQVVALRATVREIQRRHEILRTTFRLLGGKPVQAVARTADLLLPLLDLSGLSSHRCEAEARRVVTEESGRPYDLIRGPLLRGLLLRLEPEEHVLMLGMHHIVTDGWSLGLWLREMNALYPAFCAGRPSPLRELPIQYADFAHWQRQWLQGEVLETQLSFWRRQLADAPAALELRIDRPRPARPSFRGGHESFALPEELAAKLQTLSRRENGTLFITLLAAFNVLLCRWNGQEDIVVGTPIANRHHKAIQDLVGFFVNSLSLRTELSGNPTFRELLAQTRERTLQAYAHQDLPFERLVEDLQPERVSSRPPLFQVMFAMQNNREERFDLPGLTVRPFRVGTRVVRFDLELHMFEQGKSLSGVLLYSTDLFESDTIRCIVTYFQSVLERIAEDPDCRVLEIPIGARDETESFSPLAMGDEDALFSFQLEGRA